MKNIDFIKRIEQLSGGCCRRRTDNGQTAIVWVPVDPCWAKMTQDNINLRKEEIIILCREMPGEHLTVDTFLETLRNFDHDAEVMIKCWGGEYPATVTGVITGDIVIGCNC